MHPLTQKKSGDPLKLFFKKKSSHVKFQAADTCEKRLIQKGLQFHQILRSIMCGGMVDCSSLENIWKNVAFDGPIQLH